MNIVSALSYQCFDRNYIAAAAQNMTPWLQLKYLLMIFMPIGQVMQVWKEMFVYMLHTLSGNQFCL